MQLARLIGPDLLALAEENPAEVAELVDEIHPEDVAQIVAELEDEQARSLLTALPTDYAAQVLARPNPLDALGQRYQGGSFVGLNYSRVDSGPDGSTAPAVRPI